MCPKIFFYLQLKEYRVHTSSGSALMFGVFCHIGLHATTAEISFYMICQRYWKLYHWQSTNVVHA
jgi:hypothetical protein